MGEFQKGSIYDRNMYITKLFCIGYIKSYCYIFVKMNDNKKFNPQNIIKIINEYDKKNMIELYIYKIIYNKNKKQINKFLDNTIISKYKLELYKGFKSFKENIKEIKEKNSYEITKSNYIYEILEKLSMEQFKKKITMDDISDNEYFDFDDFYMAAHKLILSKLNNEAFKNDDSYVNFYKNICKPLFENNVKLISLMKFIFEEEEYIKIKIEYNINIEDIEVLLYGYRYCLNEFKNEDDDDEKREYIYSYLYNMNNHDFNNKFYPGCDNKDEPYYDLYNKIVYHFKEKPNEGCFVCLCDKGYYHSIISGFPGICQINMHCPKCGNKIGSKEVYKKEDDENKTKLIKIYETITSNKNYYRIFKDEEEIEKLKLNKENFKKLQNLNYMTLEEFKKKYILPLYNKENGLNAIDKDNFKKDNKIIRNLSKLSYRLLNYILYCHLFFAKLFTGSEIFDNYIPKGITWFTLIKECFNKIKKELKLKGIENIEIFMNYIFKDLFEKLHEKECINNIEALIKFEDELEKLIQEKCEKVKEEIEKYKELVYKDKKSPLALLKEIYDKDKYERYEFPYYEHFYYTDYLNEGKINNILELIDKNEYPVLDKYLKYKKQNKFEDSEKKKDKYSLKDLYLFNKVLNLFNDIYSNKIKKEFSKIQKIRESEIYKDKNNSKLIDEFIKLYNNFEYVDYEGNKLELNIDTNYLCDFLLIDDNKYGQSYKKIYKIFIDKQNKELENLLDDKINTGEFDLNCKKRINVQNIKENEIFILDKNFNFINILYNSSYRKFIDTNNYENYNEYQINLKQIESEMTDCLLKNKKLLNDDLKEFTFYDEIFNNEINDLISNFKYEKLDINIDEKLIIYDFIVSNSKNIEKYKIIIDDFITLIKYLNEIQNNNINNTTKISEIEIVKNLGNISNDFKNIFEEKKHSSINVNLTVNKIINLFDYYLKLIFKFVKKNIEKYQEKINFDEKLINSLEEIFKANTSIQKTDLASVIRIFITLILFREREEDMDKKIRKNSKNIVDYLKNKNLWKPFLYNNEAEFEENLAKIKKLNIKIKEILYFYYYLVDNKNEEFEVDVEKYLKENNQKITQTKSECSDKIDKESNDSSDEEYISDDDDSDKEERKKRRKRRIQNSDED